MERNQILFGRNVFEEALSLGIEIQEIYFDQASSKKWIEETLEKFSGRASSRSSLRQGLPREIQGPGHQGVCFRVRHEFYHSISEIDVERDPLLVLCNHLEDVQNLGAIARLAAAFGATWCVHEESRSASLTATAIKVSAGQAFRIKFAEVSNLTPHLIKLKEKGYFSVGLDSTEGALNLYEWDPGKMPWMVVLGSEGQGLSRPIMKQLDQLVRIPMMEGVESLNVSQAAGVALSWMHRCRGK